MLYIHKTTCISPQQTFLPPETDTQAQTSSHQSGIDLLQLNESVNNKLSVIEPDYEGLPKNAARRMSKSVRIGVGAALPLMKRGSIDGIIIGTASTGMEESIQFMKQIIDHEEGILSPGAFVQSTANTVASQISQITGNKGYNSTHVQGGLAFENALLDAAMLLAENPSNTYLLGGVDEIGAYNNNIDYLDGWYKEAPFSSKQLYSTNSAGSLPGEGSAMFLVSRKESDAWATSNAPVKLQALTTLHSESLEDIEPRLKLFLDQYVPHGEKIDLLLSGENGDNRLLKYYTACEAICEANQLTIARFKHMCGEYPTASAFACWLAAHLLGNQSIPPHMIKKQATTADPVYKNILIYNTYKGRQHSFMLVSKIC
jgi:beta-ketoacyl synthase-like protein